MLRLFALLFLVLLISFDVNSINLTDIKNRLNEVDRDTLVIFDVDGVLLDRYGFLNTYHQEYIKYIKLKLKKYEKDEAEKILSLVYNQFYNKDGDIIQRERVHIIDRKMPQIIKNIQQKGIKTIALTASGTGNFGYFEDLQDIRINTLKNLGISFENSFRDYTELRFSGDILFKSGILFSGQQSKGKTLEAFLDKINYKPKKIIFIDDKQDNIESIRDFCIANNIYFIGMLYKEISHDRKFFDEQKAQVEFDKILKEHYNLKKELCCRYNYSPKAFTDQFLINTLLNTNASNYNMPPAVDHIIWLTKIYEFLKNHEDEDEKIFNAKDNLLFYFDRNDARTILKPILKKFFNYELNEEVIKRIFQEQCKLYKDNHNKTNIEFFLRENTMINLYQAAKMAYKISKDNTVLILGQTPAYLGIMIDEIRKLNDDSLTEVIFIPFSGKPDYIQKIRGIWNMKQSYLNLLDQEREKIFRKVLIERGFHPKNFTNHNRKIFIIDNSTGPSFASFATLIYRWFYEENIVNIPKIHILHQAKQKDLYVQNDKGRYINVKDLNLKMSDTLIFNFPITFIGLQDDILTQFDKIYDNLRIVPSFNSLMWRANYAELFKQYPTEEATYLINKYKNYVAKKLYPSKKNLKSTSNNSYAK